MQGAFLFPKGSGEEIYAAEKKIFENAVRAI